MGFDDDLKSCAELVQKGDVDRFQAVMAAPVATREVLFTLYAFNVELSRAPWASSESMIAEMRLQWWRDMGNEIASGKSVRRHFIGTPLARLLRPELATTIDAMAEARRWDIYRDPFADEAEFDGYIDATSGGLMWMAAASLGAADEAVVRDFAYGVGVAKWLQAIPKLEAQKRVPLLDGTPDGVRALACKALERLMNARAAGGRVSPSAGVALLAGWQAEAILRQIIQQPERVALGALGQSEFRRRAGLIWRAALGRW
ncbi:squalene/phytoene synthase family protein [Parasedimentitalea psychrophila]|uniref:Squalene/phytoene synthase family protein n=1 Tax=Parasedimentitalea psychrophila TaxID=2997337 RepID=A0A9Y2P2B2_9RHOB|nr:squalene/phytoene synthase family protein [Parasedimentitalea psychrophila]WIY24902.1 squalene/phytoene synthase family protein [Parasedimentitalea psychrophila]